MRVRNVGIIHIKRCILEYYRKDYKTESTEWLFDTFASPRPRWHKTYENKTYSNPFFFLCCRCGPVNPGCLAASFVSKINKAAVRQIGRRLKKWYVYYTHIRYMFGNGNVFFVEFLLIISLKVWRLLQLLLAIDVCTWSQWTTIEFFTQRHSLRIFDYGLGWWNLKNIWLVYRWFFGFW